MANPPAVMLTAPGGWENFATQGHQIDVYVNDSGGSPVELTTSDIWLENDATQPCPGGWIADSSTYAPGAGFTTFSGTPRGGIPIGAQCRAEQTEVIAIGHTIQILDLRFASADLDGDGHVVLADFAIFGACFNAPCSDNCWCRDLDKTNETEPLSCVKLADLALFGSKFNASDCP